MALYEYHCSSCKNVYEKIQNFNSEPDKFCPKCGEPVERPLFGSSLIFHGTGFYVNDYGKHNDN
jgi:putative FmdB family regulatory protein